MKIKKKNQELESKYTSSIVDEYEFPEDVLFEVPYTDKIYSLEMDLELAESKEEYNVIYEELKEAKQEALREYKSVNFFDKDTEEFIIKGYIKK